MIRLQYTSITDRQMDDLA